MLAPADADPAPAPPVPKSPARVAIAGYRLGRFHGLSSLGRAAYRAELDTPVWLALAGVVATAWGAVRLWRTKTFLDRAHRSPGRYVSSVRRGSGEEAATHMAVEFETADGRSIQFVTRTAVFFFPSRRVEKPIEVLYDPEDPQKAVVNSWIDTWWPALFLVVFGILVLLAVLGVVPLEVG